MRIYADENSRKSEFSVPRGLITRNFSFNPWKSTPWIKITRRSRFMAFSFRKNYTQINVFFLHYIARILLQNYILSRENTIKISA